MLLLLFSWNSAKSDVTIANFQDDYLAGVLDGQTRVQRSADGWNYMSGANASLGNASTYTNLTWSTPRLQYDNGGTTPIVYGSPPDVRLGLSDTSNVILAYTIQSGEEGFISIASSQIRVRSGAAITYSIFVDNTQIGTSVTLPSVDFNGPFSSFNTDLGYLNANQTVYVTVGTGSTNQIAQINYSLVNVPEPSTYILCGMSTAVLAAMMYFHTRRKQRERLALIAASAE